MHALDGPRLVDAIAERLDELWFLNRLLGMAAGIPWRKKRLGSQLLGLPGWVEGRRILCAEWLAKRMGMEGADALLACHAGGGRVASEAGYVGCIHRGRKGSSRSRKRSQARGGLVRRSGIELFPEIARLDRAGTAADWLLQEF